MKKYIYLFLFILFHSQISFAAVNEKPSRWIDIEWEEVPGAKGYDIELFEVIDQKEFSRGVFHTNDPHWAKEANPGKYNIKMRALDNRKVPGPWGEAIPFVIKLETAQLLRPLENEEIQKEEISKTKIIFQWSKVFGADDYVVKIYNSKNSVIKTENTKNNEVSIDLDEIGDYFWNVAPRTSNEEEMNGIPDDKLPKKKFSIRGEKLKSPVIEIDQRSPKGIIFKWQEVYRAEEYEVNISKVLEDKNEIVLQQNTKKNIYALARNKIPQDKWLLSVSSKSKNYKRSEEARVILKTEKNSTEIISNESIFKETNYRHPNKSYLGLQIGYPSIAYANKNYEKDTKNSQSLRGILIIGLSSLQINETYNIYSTFSLGQFADSYAEVSPFSLSSGFRKVWGSSHLKFQTGLSLGISSTPMLFSNRLSTTSVTQKDFIAAYPEVNFQLNYKFTDHFEVEAQSRIDYSLLNLKSSVSGEINQTLNLNYYLKLIYNINSNFNFSGAFNIYNLNNQTKAKTGSDSFALPGDVNESKLTSRYINFGVEYFY